MPSCEGNALAAGGIEGLPRRLNSAYSWTHQGRTYISWHRQPVTALGRAANSNGTLVPIEVVQPQLDNPAGTQSEPRKQQQDGVVTTSGGRSPIAPGKQPVHLRRRYRLGDPRHRPVRYRGHTGMQVCWISPR